MFSVICPTMWRSEAIDIMINQQCMLDSPAIGEFLLINNHPATERPLKHPKIRTIHRGNNLFVNPAWNLGVREAKYDQICLLSDDTIFEPSVFEQMINLAVPEKGIFGLGPNCVIGESGYLTPRPLEMVPANGNLIQYPRDYGMLMFFHKTAYTHIPEELKIFVGDLWIYAHNVMKRKVQNYYITNLDVITKASTTSRSPDFVDQNNHECCIVEGIFANKFGPNLFVIR